MKTDMHIFGDRQADINWENEEVRQEIYKMLHWWLGRGLDGFRVWPLSGCLLRQSSFADRSSVRLHEPDIEG